MIIYFGTRLYGRTHVVPKTCHVATCFFHIYRIPLIPLRSWIVTSQSGSTWQGIKTTLSLKSVFLAWLRAAIVLVSVSACIAGATELILKGAAADRVLIGGCTGLIAAAFVLWHASYAFSIATPAKTRELLAKLGMSEPAPANLAFANETPHAAVAAR